MNKRCDSFKKLPEWEAGSVAISSPDVYKIYFPFFS